MAGKYILALDQGTTSSQAILFDHDGHVFCQRSQEFRQIYPQPGWVEHNAEDIWSSQLHVATQVLQDRNLTLHDIAAISIANQRETTVVWERKNGAGRGVSGRACRGILEEYGSSPIQLGAGPSV